MGRERVLYRQTAQPVAEADDLGTIRGAFGRNQPVAQTRTVIDPILKSRDVYVDCYERIDRCVREMAKVLRRGELVAVLRYNHVGTETRAAS